MKKTTAAMLMASAVLLPTVASGKILLAGFHNFVPGAVGPDPGETSYIAVGGTTKTQADEGILASAVAGGGRSTRLTVEDASGFGGTGGSLDNWYGPDSTALGGMRTQQISFDPNAGGGDAYKPEVDFGVDPGNVRFDSAAFAGAGGDGNFQISQPGTTMDGRVTDIASVFVYVANDTQEAHPLKSFVFDAFLGDASTGQPQVIITDVEVRLNNDTFQRAVTRGYAGLNDIDPVVGLNDPLDMNASVIAGGPPTAREGAIVSNRIDFGTGTNYLDYVVDLTGITLGPGDQIRFKFNTHGDGAIVRVDNLALFAVPEPSSAMSLAALVGAGCFFRRRKNVTTASI